MKKIIFSLALLLFALNLFSQVPATPTRSSEYYLNKSKNQKTAARILLGGGAVLLMTAIVIPKGDVTFSDFGFRQEYRNDGIRGSFGSVGVLSMLTSIPFHLSSSKNKRRAKAAILSLNNQQVLFPVQNTLVLKTQPALSLKVTW